MHKFFLLPLIVLLGFIQPLNADIRSPDSHFFMDSFGDYQEELGRAKEEGKKGIMLFFEMDECPFCHRMKTTIFNQSDVQDFYRDNFLVFTVDIEGDIEMVDFQGKTLSQKDFAEIDNRVRATPVIAFFDLTGERIMKYTGPTKDKKEFLLLGKYVAEAHYKESNFTRYKRDNK